MFIGGNPKHDGDSRQLLADDRTDSETLRRVSKLAGYGSLLAGYVAIMVLVLR